HSWDVDRLSPSADINRSICSDCYSSQGVELGSTPECAEAYFRIDNERTGIVIVGNIKTDTSIIKNPIRGVYRLSSMSSLLVCIGRAFAKLRSVAVNNQRSFRHADTLGVLELKANLGGVRSRCNKILGLHYAGRSAINQINAFVDTGVSHFLI